MIIPAVGRVMWYWPAKEHRGDQPWAATVAYVHGDNMVNLAVIDANGNANGGKTSVPIVQEGSPYTAGASPYAEWMPYQIGQAARTAGAK